MAEVDSCLLKEVVGFVLLSVTDDGSFYFFGCRCLLVGLDFLAMYGCLEARERENCLKYSSNDFCVNSGSMASTSLMFLGTAVVRFVARSCILNTEALLVAVVVASPLTRTEDDNCEGGV